MLLTSSHHKRKRFNWRYLVILVALMATTAFASNALAMGYGGIGGRPAYPRPDNPRTESIFIHTLDPGVVQKDGILLVNNTEKQKTLQVYAVDSMVSSGGAFACRQMTEPKNDVGNWIKLKKSEVTLNSKANEIVPFTITVPQNAGVGEHNGCIRSEERRVGKECRSRWSP